MSPGFVHLQKDLRTSSFPSRRLFPHQQNGSLCLGLVCDSSKMMCPKGLAGRRYSPCCHRAVTAGLVASCPLLAWRRGGIREQD